MLIGGNPLPERPLWVRLLIVAMVLSAASPLIKSTAATLQDQFLKMNAADTAVHLSTYPGLSMLSGRERRVQCEPGLDGWDYVCTYANGVNGVKQLRRKVGVRVGHRSVTMVSAPHALEERRITRWNLHGSR